MRNVRHLLGVSLACAFLCLPPSVGLAKLAALAQDPCIGSIALDADTGSVLSQQNADAVAYPASVVKMMDTLVIVERIEQGAIQLSDKVKITKETYGIGGTQVWLDPTETFTVEDLMYAMMIRSANDAAVALASHVAGSKDAFVDLMNKRAAQLRMTNTTFHSVHGLPPDPRKKQEPDKTTPRDMAILARELVKHPLALRLTSTKERKFREGKKGMVDMVSHNRLLWTVEGCDGLKTGFFDAAGFSIVATAKRNDRRVIAVVMGSKNKKMRDKIASELIAKAFLALPPLPAPAPTKPAIAAATPPPEIAPADGITRAKWRKIGLAAGASALAMWLVGWLVLRRPALDFDRT